MWIQELKLYNFRSHTNRTFAFSQGINFIHGLNGIGKTNLLEAIHYLCLTKSFLVSKDQYVLQFGQPFFELEGNFASDAGLGLQVKLVYMPDEGKRIFINRVALPSLSEMIGRIPLVLFSPEDRQITNGGPEERRRFLNNILSQTRPVYLKALLHYQRILTQRNALLFQIKRQKQDAGLKAVLQSWNEELIRTGVRLIHTRLAFLAAFGAFLDKAHTQIEAVGEKPTILYQTLSEINLAHSETEIEAAFRKQLARVEKAEQDQGRTLAGPHRDELVFKLNDFEVRRFASQGQHRTFGLALQLAKYYYIEDQMEERPLLLLDDIFGDLDKHRTEIFLQLLQSKAMGQTIITGVDADVFQQFISFNSTKHSLIYMSKADV